jgi:hypothetical protein
MSAKSNLLWATASLKQIAWDSKPVLWSAGQCTAVAHTLHSHYSGYLKSRKCVCVCLVVCWAHISPLLHFTTQSYFVFKYPRPSQFWKPQENIFLPIAREPFILAYWGFLHWVLLVRIKDSFLSLYVYLLSLLSQDSAVGIATGYGLDDQGVGVGSAGGGKNFHFSMSSRLALGSTQPPIWRVPGAISPGVKWPGHEADHPPPPSTEIEKMWVYTATLTLRLHAVVLN